MPLPVYVIGVILFMLPVCSMEPTLPSLTMGECPKKIRVGKPLRLTCLLRGTPPPSSVLAFYNKATKTRSDCTLHAAMACSHSSLVCGCTERDGVKTFHALSHSVAMATHNGSWVCLLTSQTPSVAIASQDCHVNVVAPPRLANDICGARVCEGEPLYVGYTMSGDYSVKGNAVLTFLRNGDHSRPFCTVSVTKKCSDYRPECGCIVGYPNIAFHLRIPHASRALHSGNWSAVVNSSVPLRGDVCRIQVKECVYRVLPVMHSSGAGAVCKAWLWNALLMSLWSLLVPTGCVDNVGAILA